MSLKLSSDRKMMTGFLDGKSEITVSLFHHLIDEYKKNGNITIQPAKTMTGIAYFAQARSRHHTFQ